MLETVHIKPEPALDLPEPLLLLENGGLFISFLLPIVHLVDLLHHPCLGLLSLEPHIVGWMLDRDLPGLLGRMLDGSGLWFPDDDVGSS